MELTVHRMERTTSEVHATLCTLVTTRAAASSAWSEYASVLLDAETQAFFAARLSNPSEKKRKLRDDSDAGTICDHCGSAVPEVSLRVACLDGTTLEVTIPERGLVQEVKRLVGQVLTVIIPNVNWFLNSVFFSRATWTRA